MGSRRAFRHTRGVAEALEAACRPARKRLVLRPSPAALVAIRALNDDPHFCGEARPGQRAVMSSFTRWRCAG
jgi:hypothetical protein